MNLRATQPPDFETLRAGLLDLADALQAQLHELYERPSAPAAETAAINLDGARRAVLRFSEAMRLESIHDAA